MHLKKLSLPYTEETESHRKGIEFVLCCVYALLCNTSFMFFKVFIC